MLPWQFNVSFPEFGFAITPMLTMNLSRDKDLWIILSLSYFFHTVPISFNAAYPKVCPHIAFSVLVKRTRESRNHPTRCPFCNTPIHSLYTGRTSDQGPNSEGIYRHFLIQVRRKNGVQEKFRMKNWRLKHIWGYSVSSREYKSSCEQPQS